MHSYLVVFLTVNSMLSSLDEYDRCLKINKRKHIKSVYMTADSCVRLLVVPRLWRTAKIWNRECFVVFLSLSAFKLSVDSESLLFVSSASQIVIFFVCLIHNCLQSVREHITFSPVCLCSFCYLFLTIFRRCRELTAPKCLNRARSVEQRRRREKTQLHHLRRFLMILLRKSAKFKVHRRVLLAQQQAAAKRPHWRKWQWCV